MDHPIVNIWGRGYIAQCQEKALPSFPLPAHIDSWAGGYIASRQSCYILSLCQTNLLHLQSGSSLILILRGGSLPGYIWVHCKSVRFAPDQSYKHCCANSRVSSNRTGQKIVLYGQKLIWYFGTKLAKSTQLSLSGPWIKAHEV